MRLKRRCRVTRVASEGLLRVSAQRALGGTHVSPVRRDLVLVSQDLGRAHSHQSFAELIDERIDVVVRMML
jgi:hypothetical protein